MRRRRVRASVSEQVVVDYAERMAAGDTFPPVVVFSNGAGGYDLADGVHRIRAARRNGATTINAEVRRLLIDALFGKRGRASAGTVRTRTFWLLPYPPRPGRLRRRVLGEGLSLAYAQGVWEDEARRLGAGRLVTREAPWRQHPATPGQLRALRRWRVPIPANVTKGEAADLIAAAVARAA